MMRRRAFLSAVSLFAAVPALARAHDEFDPARSAPVASLRVLLGRGSAETRSAGGFTYDGRRYRGTFVRDADGSIVSTVPLEEYLYSVVPREMSPSWPASALQAQAIAARTYVLARSSPRRAYDLVPSEADQVYGGVSSESPAARAAVDATSGAVLRFADGYAQTLYSSCCGGHTESASDAWGGSAKSYLGGVVCAYCTASPYFRWVRELALDDVSRTFALEITPFGTLRTLRAGPVDGSGRLRTLELVCDGGSAFIEGMRFRLRIGPRRLPSLLISSIAATAEEPSSVRIAGGGLGHGVGLCQWGARGMALAGASPNEILNLYFPGTTMTHD